jgi:uncharacterized membrane protein
MAEEVTDRESDDRRVQLLLKRYGQLEQTINAMNNVIHTNFYLSVVFFAGMLNSLIPYVPQRRAEIGLTAVVATVVFLFMTFITRGYQEGRRQQVRQKNKLVNEIAAVGSSIATQHDVRSLFDTVVQSGRRSDLKDTLNIVYFVALTVTSLAIAVDSVLLGFSLI